MELLNSDYKKKWNKIPNRTDAFLKKISVDLYNNKIFCDRNCKSEEICSVFMAILFLGPKCPTEPSLNLSGDISEKRDQTIDYLDTIDEIENKYDKEMEIYENAVKFYNENFVNSIGLMYEYLDKSTQLSINGNPTFYSLQLLNIEDTEKMFKYYEDYKNKREEIDLF